MSSPESDRRQLMVETPPPNLQQADSIETVDNQRDRQQQQHDDHAQSGDHDPFDLEPKFERLPTIIPASVGILLNLIMIILVFLLPMLCEASKKSPDDTDPCPLEPFSILVYTHTVHWVIHLIVDQFLKQKHKKNRLQGYIEFYLTTKNIRRTPFYLVSVGNAVLLITVTALSDYCDVYGCKNKFMKVDYLRGLITLECLIIMCLWVRYIVHVRDFHSSHPLPDVLRDDARRRLLMDVSKADDREEVARDQEEVERLIGMPKTTEERDEVIEKQAEVLRFLHSHIAKLNRKIVSLAHQLEQAGPPRY